LMNRPDLRLWALWLALLLLVPLALDVVGVRPNAVPGTGAERPPLAPDRLLDEAYYAEIDTWLRDGGAARGLGLWARYQIDYKLFGDATGAAIVVGDNGWLFSRGWIDVPCVHIRAIEPPTHPGFIWTVPIAKVHWLADLLEPHDRPASCTVEARNELRQRMADDPQAIDLNDAIDADPAGRFYARDPHWNGMGRVEVARLLVERYAPGLWDPDAVRVDEERGLQGMDRFMGINYETVLADRRVDRGVEVEHVKPQAYGLGQLIWQHTRVADAPVIDGECDPLHRAVLRGTHLRRLAAALFCAAPLRCLAATGSCSRRIHRPVGRGQLRHPGARRGHRAPPRGMRVSHHRPGRHLRYCLFSQEAN
jgi:hypothetical protein